jgi:hypothetical protein
MNKDMENIKGKGHANICTDSFAGFNCSFFDLRELQQSIVGQGFKTIALHTLILQSLFSSRDFHIFALLPSNTHYHTKSLEGF